MITKTSYRDQVRNILLGRMKSGVLKAGNNISLAELSRELNISVTPIREALTQLEQSHIVKAIPNRGFIVPHIEKNEVKNLYELVVCLEVFAIQNSKLNAEIIKKLKKQQIIFKNTANAIERINADMQFHEILVSNYKNAISNQILRDLKIRIFFCELDFMKDNDFLSKSHHHHDEIIKYLELGNKSEAIKILKENWMQILNYT
ncbi:GntR family transcriptional regulator [Psychroserpens sp. MEBiC05023]